MAVPMECIGIETDFGRRAVTDQVLPNPQLIHGARGNIHQKKTSLTAGQDQICEEQNKSISNILEIRNKRVEGLVYPQRRSRVIDICCSGNKLNVI